VQVPKPRDNDKARLSEIDSVLEQLERLKADTVKITLSLQKQRDYEHARLSKEQEKP
jgi:hypothetical protein